MADLTRCIREVQDRKEPVHIIYKSHDRWPLPPTSVEPEKQNEIESTRGEQKAMILIDLRIAVLDSSFNPPTLAHLALARSKPPDSTKHINYDACLLLLSVRNADKAPPKPGEATYEQRLEMMKLLAKELEDAPAESSTPRTTRNVGVAIIDEPTFVRKSAILREYLRYLVATLEGLVSDNSESKELTRREIKLSFIMGFDTLERFLAPRYYNNSVTNMHDALRGFFALPPVGDGSEVICAWRGQTQPNQAQRPSELEDLDTKKLRETLSVAQLFISAGNVSFILLTDYEMSLSSTEVRQKRMAGAQEWRKMIPSRVREYIENSGLYVWK